MPIGGIVWCNGRINSLEHGSYRFLEIMYAAITWNSIASADVQPWKSDADTPNIAADAKNMNLYIVLSLMIGLVVV